MRYDERPADDSPVTTAELPATPTRDRTSWPRRGSKRRRSCSPWEQDLPGAPVATYKRRIGDWLLWRAGPATDADACYWAARADNVAVQSTFRLFPDGSGSGTGPSGREHTRFRTWKEDLLGREEPLGHHH